MFDFPLTPVDPKVFQTPPKKKPEETQNPAPQLERRPSSDHPDPNQQNWSK